VGTHPISATYGGDGSFNGSTGALALDLQVNPADSLVSVASSQNPVVVGQVVTFTATLAAAPPGGGTPTGQVVFSIDGSSVFTTTASGGVAVLGAAGLLTGTHPVTVNYLGDANFNASSGSLNPDQAVVDTYSLYLPLTTK
jgi:hypothetical protein